MNVTSICFKGTQVKPTAVSRLNLLFSRIGSYNYVYVYKSHEPLEFIFTYTIWILLFGTQFMRTKENCKCIIGAFTGGALHLFPYINN